MIQSVVDSVVYLDRNFSETCGGQTFFLFLSVPVSPCSLLSITFPMRRMTTMPGTESMKSSDRDRNLVKTGTAVELRTLGRNHAAR